MFWKRPPVRPLRLLSVAVLVIAAIFTIVPETPAPWGGAMATQLAALGEVLGLGPTATE